MPTFKVKFEVRAKMEPQVEREGGCTPGVLRKCWRQRRLRGNGLELQEIQDLEGFVFRNGLE
jgi:hypothetical protein